jgi:hypothetical protein
VIKAHFLIGFTGHRSGLNEELIRPAMTAVLADLQMRAVKAGGTAELYASLAEGADALCIESARSLDLPVHLLLPLPEAEFSQDFTSLDAWQRSQAEIEHARMRPGRDSVHLVPGESARPECYFNQGIHMLDAVDVLVAVWDGAPARGMGGTAEMVNHARAIGVPVVWIDSKTASVTLDDGVTNAFKRDAVIDELNQIAAETHDKAVHDEVSSPDVLQTALDEIAMQEASRFRPSLIRIILLHGIAASLAALVTFKAAEGSSWENLKWLVTFAELVLVSFALWMSYRIHRRHIQQRWIRCRFACEIVRGLRTSVPILDPLHPAISRHEPEWRRFCLSAGLLVLAAAETHDPLQLRDKYIQIRLSDTHPDGQVLHYLKMRPKALRWWTWTGRLSDWSARLAPLFVLLSLINKLSKNHPSGGLGMEKHFVSWIAVVFLPIGLPLLAGVASGLRQALDTGRRKDRYPQMVARLNEIKASLAGLQTPSTIQRIVTRSEEILLDELLEWKLAMKNTGH